MPNAEGDADEIARIEREIENLVRRYRGLEGMVWWLKFSFRTFVAGLIAMAAFGMATDNSAMFMVAIAFLVLSALGALVGPTDWSFHRVRWIDLVGWEPGALGISVKRSEAMAIEDMIAERARRLEELRGPAH
jgi:hypothetical protein